MHLIHIVNQHRKQLLTIVSRESSSKLQSNILSPNLLHWWTFVEYRYSVSLLINRVCMSRILFFSRSLHHHHHLHRHRRHHHSHFSLPFLIRILTSSFTTNTSHWQGWEKQITVICCRSSLRPNVYYHNWGNDKIRKEKKSLSSSRQLAS